MTAISTRRASRESSVVIAAAGAYPSSLRVLCVSVVLMKRTMEALLAEERPRPFPGARAIGRMSARSAMTENRGMLTASELAERVGQGAIETVVAGFTDGYGRLM